MDGLLAKYAANACTAAEKQQVEAWLKEGEEHAQMLEHTLWVWEKSAPNNPAADAIDVDAAWQKHLDLRKQKAPATIHSIGSQRRWMAMAAAVVALLALVWAARYLLRPVDNEPVLVMQHVSTDNFTKTDTLADGTIVSLNKFSAIDYPQSFTDSIRLVTLTGEAFFDVASNAEQPFIIDANGVQIRVVGTAFNVKTSTGKTEVIVEEGKVEVSKQKQTVALTPGQKIVVYDTTATLTPAANTNNLYQYYRSDVFVCDDTPLPDLIEALNDAYGAHIVLNSNRLQQMRITSTFNNESLDNILNIIALTFDLTVEKQGNTILLR